VMRSEARRGQQERRRGAFKLRYVVGGMPVEGRRFRGTGSQTAVVIVDSDNLSLIGR